MIYPQYFEQYKTDLFLHYDSLPYAFFWWNIFSLGGSYGEIIQLRQKWLDGAKLDKQERKQLRKVMTPEMQDYQDLRFKEITAENGRAILDKFTSDIQAKIRKKQEEQNGTTLQT